MPIRCSAKCGEDAACPPNKKILSIPATRSIASVPGFGINRWGCMVTMSKFLRIAVPLLLAIVMTANSRAADVEFNIARFEVQGNTLLPTPEIETLLAPFAGPKRVYGDIQKALEALEKAYHSAGYSTVQIYVPEQELTSGVVRLKVAEGVIGEIATTGNHQFSRENILASLPQLKVGSAPSARRLSQNIQLANENPAKQVEVTLAMAEDEEKVNAKVKVTESPPQRFVITADDTGSAQTGHTRVGFAYQNANIADRDGVLTAAYTTSPDAPSGVSVNIFSVAYRMPFYDLGDSLDVVFGSSNVNTPVAQTTGFGMTGKGRVLGVRWNHYFPRQGEFSSRVIAGFDWKTFDTTCNIGIVTQPTPTAPGPCVPHTTRPLSLGYVGQWQNPGYLADVNATIVRNLSMGYRYLEPFSGHNDHYTYIAGRHVDDDFTLMRAGGNYTSTLAGLPVRAALSSQWSSSGLVPGEQLGLVGALAVRGFPERAIATDSGYFGNLELYTDDLASRVKLDGNLRGLVFYDFATGWNNSVIGATTFRKATVSSWGLGLRYSLGKNMALRADMAEVLEQGPLTTVGKGHWRGHFTLSIGF